jgi:uncharacterized lipoprotein YddW (UPF0748 family)
VYADWIQAHDDMMDWPIWIEQKFILLFVVQVNWTSLEADLRLNLGNEGI